MIKNKSDTKTVKHYDGSTRLKSVLQEAFVTNLIKNCNQTDAYRKAGYKSKTPDRQANQLMRNSKVQVRLDFLRDKLAEKTGITAEMVVQELAKIGFANIRDFLDPDNTIKDLTELPRELTLAVESIQTDIRHDSGDSDGYTEKVRFKLYNKISALDKLCLHLGLYEKDNAQRSPKTVICFKDSSGRKILSNVIDQPAALPAPEAKDG